MEMLNQLVEYFAMELSVPHQAEEAKVSYRDVQTENQDSQWKPHSYSDLYIYLIYFSGSPVE